VANTAGKPCPGVEVAIMDGAGRLLPPGEPGEVVLRGYIVMQGYYNDPEATAKTIDAAGWLHSGDVGHIDANGDLHIQDRLKDIYICGGFNCYPAEIERLLSAHPAINQIAVIGVPDERLGEVGHAFVVLRPGAEATEAGIIAWARAHIANFKVPRRVEFREALPTSPQGKVLKTVLREAVAAAAAAAPGG
jgi:acyl-CoA synthetase (AMP-forming)/AMP-acid ligase II